ncbi:MAG: helix-turn-helix transcriptional regulator [Micavibrio sp.]
MLITADQIRAARALKNWSQTDLAERTGLAVPTIANIELGKQMPGKNTIEKIIDAFTLGGVDFTERGVEKKDEKSKFINLLKKDEDDNIYISLVEDMLYTLTNIEDEEKREVLIFCGDDRISPPAINKLYKKMRESGIRYRKLTEEGNTYLLAGIEEYRYIPSEYYLNNVTAVYGDKYAICLGNVNSEKPDEIILINDEGTARIHRNLFDLLWSQLPMPKKSTAPDKEKFPPVKAMKSNKTAKKKGRK